MLIRPRDPRLWRLITTVTLTVVACVLRVCFDQAGLVHAAPSGWLWPIDGPRQVNREFVAPLTDYSAGHRGIDIPAPMGTELRAPSRARVAFVGHVVDRDVVTLDVGDGWLVTFDGALASVSLDTALGAGDRVGTVAATPHCSCVHVGLRHAGEYVNPLLVWGTLPRAVLLPW